MIRTAASGLDFNVDIVQSPTSTTMVMLFYPMSMTSYVSVCDSQLKASIDPLLQGIFLPMNIDLKCCMRGDGLLSWKRAFLLWQLSIGSNPDTSKRLEMGKGVANTVYLAKKESILSLC
jgi:hypothetical protein